jgi:hypothetical protein
MANQFAREISSELAENNDHAAQRPGMKLIGVTKHVQAYDVPETWSPATS